MRNQKLESLSTNLDLSSVTSAFIKSAGTNPDPKVVYTPKTIIAIYYKSMREIYAPFNSKGFIKNPEMANGSINVDSIQNA